jgi:hypothetical protein
MNEEGRIKALLFSLFKGNCCVNIPEIGRRYTNCEHWLLTLITGESFKPETLY